MKIPLSKWLKVLKRLHLAPLATEETPNLCWLGNGIKQHGWIKLRCKEIKIKPLFKKVTPNIAICSPIYTSKHVNQSHYEWNVTQNAAREYAPPGNLDLTFGGAMGLRVTLTCVLTHMCMQNKRGLTVPNGSRTANAANVHGNKTDPVAHDHYVSWYSSEN